MTGYRFLSDHFVILLIALTAVPKHERREPHTPFSISTTIADSLPINNQHQLRHHTGSQMAPYTYRALNSDLEEIRLVQLLPGEGHDQIRLNVFHVSLTQPGRKATQTRDTLGKLQKTLPDDYVVKETLDGRYIFGYTGQEERPSSWHHPCQDFDRTRYELRDDDYLPGPGYTPRYEALSYTWASSLPPTKAIVNSDAISGFDEIELGGNLASALKQLRYKTENRVLWIDAICINQNDDSERNLQVKRMGSIYSFARRVIIWLGPEKEDSTHALSTLELLADQVELSVDNALCDSPGASNPSWYSPCNPLPIERFNDTTWNSIISLFSRAWFSRVWVTQESALANRFTILHCGGFSLPWLSIRKSIGILHAKKSVPRKVKSVLDPHVPGIPPTKVRSLPSLLGFVRQKNCQVPHDKVYGILSLASPSFRNLIEPTYEKPVTQVFTSVSIAHLQLTKRLWLCQCCSISKRYPGAPSWVPNWESASNTVLFGLRTGHVRQASGQSQAHYSLLSNNTLRVAGLRCGRVDSVARAAEGDVGQIFETIRSWEPEGLCENKYRPGGSMLDAFLEAVFQGCFRDRFPRAWTWPTLSQLRECYLDLLSGADRRADIIEYLKNGVAKAAKFFTTQEGYLGVAGDVDKGDFVCIILGCDMPMLIRPTGESQDMFDLVGICFVPGLLDGESLLGPLQNDWKLQMVFENGSYVPTYERTSTKHRQPEDPRLQPLGPDWTKITRERTQDDPYFLECFQDKHGRTLNSDPRLFPNALSDRGIILEYFKLT